MSTGKRPHGPQSWEHLFDKDPNTATGFRLGIAAAVIIHVGIFAVTWPTIAQAPPEEPEQVLIPIQLVTVIPTEPEIEPIQIEVPPPPPDVPPVISAPSEPNHVEPVRVHEIELPEPPEGHVYVAVQPDPPPPQVDQEPTIIRVGLEIEAPEILFKVEPIYTSAAIQAHITGVVILELVIDTEGLVESVTVLRGQPLGLTRSAVEAVEQWRFAPSTYKQKPVAVKYNLTVFFDLK